MPNLATVILPAGLTGIPKDAFAGSVKLATVKFGDASTNNGGGGTPGRAVIGEANTITLPTGLTSLGNNAFAGTGATAVDLSQVTGLTSIGENVFRGMTNLTTVTLPSGLTTINQNAFQNDAALKTLSQANPAAGNNVQVRDGEATPGTAKFGSKLTTINQNAFQGTGFSTVDLSLAGTASGGGGGQTTPAPSLTVGSNAFTDMADLETVKLPANSNINPTYFGNPAPAEGATPKLKTITYGDGSSSSATATLSDQTISSTNFSKIANSTIEIKSNNSNTINFNGGVFFGNTNLQTLKLNVTQDPRNGSGSL